MKCPFVIKHCKKCDRLLVANTMNFYKQKDKKYGLASICKQCRGHQGGNKSKNLTDEQKKQNKKIYDAERYQNNKEKIKKCTKQYKENNKEKISQSNKKYREENKCIIKERYKEWYKQDYKNNPEKYFNNRQKRRQQEELLGNGYIENQWLEMMQFFDWKCAYSGEDLYKKTSTDHIIPLSKGGQNYIWNFAPMIFNYNCSKGAKNPLDWYKEQTFYSEERLKKIIEWQQYAYNKWSNQELPLILITKL